MPGVTGQSINEHSTIRHGVVRRRIERTPQASLRSHSADVGGNSQAVSANRPAEVFGTGGAIETRSCYPNQATISIGDAIRRDLPMNFFVDRYADNFASRLREFVAAVLHDRLHGRTAG